MIGNSNRARTPLLCWRFGSFGGYDEEFHEEHEQRE